MTASNFSSTHYEILSLPSPHQNEALSLPLLRQAYKRALLLHHPDKSTSPSLSPNSNSKYSIDQITTAYTTLRDPQARAKYNGELRLLRGRNGNGNGKEVGKTFRTGMETVDLDDLALDEGHGEGEGREKEREQIWFRGCRCGDEKGFEIKEGDLEYAAENGEQEVVVGCKGCSLWLRVLFGVLEEEEEEGREQVVRNEDAG